MTSAPKYQQVARDLLGSIESGRIAVGQQLPSEAELCAHYGVSRITVRAALSNLSDRGLVRRRPGIGTMVLRRESPARFVHASESIDSVLQFTEATHFKVLEHAWMPPPPEMVDGAGGRVLRVRGLRLDGRNRAVCLTDLYFSALHQSILGSLDGLQGSIVLLMERMFGVTLNEIEQVFEATSLSPQAAQSLKAGRGHAALRVRRWHRDVNGNLLIHSVNLYPSDRYSYKLRMRRTPEPGGES